MIFICFSSLRIIYVKMATPEERRGVSAYTPLWQGPIVYKTILIYLYGCMNIYIFTELYLNKNSEYFINIHSNQYPRSLILSPSSLHQRCPPHNQSITVIHCLITVLTRPLLCNSEVYHKIKYTRSYLRRCTSLFSPSHHPINDVLS